MNKGIAGIYQIQHVRSGKTYVGSAVNIESRWGGHIRRLRNGTHHSAKLQNAWNKYGSEAFTFTVLEFVEDAKLLIEREQYWIDFADTVKSGYNMAPKAGSILGYKFDESSRRKMSESATGHIKSPEHRMNLSKANSGKKMSDEARLKMRLAKLGKKRGPHSPETRAKMSAARIGVRLSEETKSKLAAASGRIHTKETRAKMSASHKARLGVIS